jgi:hypothetical protein
MKRQSNTNIVKNKRAKVEESEESEELAHTESEEESSSEDDAFNNENGDPKKIKLPYSEYYSNSLPVLLNSTTSRKKTIDNYIAPEKLRGTTTRSKDFPSGIFVTSVGKLDPTDKRSNIYVCVPDETDEQSQSEEASEAEDDGSESDKEDSEKDDWDAELGSKDPLENLSKAEKKRLAVEQLKENSTDTHFVFQQKSKQHQIRSRMLMDATAIVVEEWEKRKKKYKDVLKMRFESSLLCEVPKFEMKFIKTGREKPILCQFDCKELILRCQCLDTFAALPEYVTHVMESH